MTFYRFGGSQAELQIIIVKHDNHTTKHSQLTGVVTALTRPAVILGLTLAVTAVTRAVVATYLPVFRVSAAVYFWCAKWDLFLFRGIGIAPLATSSIL